MLKKNINKLTMLIVSSIDLGFQMEQYRLKI